MRRPLACLTAALLLGGCGSPAVATPSPSARPTATPSPTPSPTPAPDTQRVDVVATGLGAYMAIVVPVAVIHNAASRTGVSGLIVHFLPTRGGRPVTPVNSPPVTLYPGETLAVTGNCTDTCNCTAGCSNPDGVTVTLDSGTWSTLPGSALTATAAPPTCVNGCRGQGQWDVGAMVSGPGLPQGIRVDLFASCVDGAGTIVGGGQRQVMWPQPGGSLSVGVPTILSAPPTTCQVSASAPV